MYTHPVDLTFTQFLKFLTKIEDYSDSTKCWKWKGSLAGSGYGKFGVNNVELRAHRISYTVLIGQIPEGMQLDHLCRNRGCVNPWHVEPVTNQENAQRGDCGLHHAIKTHCPAGHEYTPENTGINPKTGCRWCRACHLEISRRSRARLKAGLPKRVVAKTHCANGHEFTPDNTRKMPNGNKFCIACGIERKRQEADKLKAARVRKVKKQRVLKTHCIHGHEYTPENTIPRMFNGRIKRECRICHNGRRRKPS